MHKTLFFFYLFEFINLIVNIHGQCSIDKYIKITSRDINRLNILDRLIK